MQERFSLDKQPVRDLAACICSKLAPNWAPKGSRETDGRLRHLWLC